MWFVARPFSKAFCLVSPNFCLFCFIATRDRHWCTEKSQSKGQFLLKSTQSFAQFCLPLTYVIFFLFIQLLPFIKLFASIDCIELIFKFVVAVHQTPRKPPTTISNDVERSNRKSRISKSQPGSRSTSPSSRLSYYSSIPYYDDTENINPDEIYDSLKKTSYEIQKYSFNLDSETLTPPNSNNNGAENSYDNSIERSFQILKTNINSSDSALTIASIKMLTKVRQQPTCAYFFVLIFIFSH